MFKPDSPVYPFLFTIGGLLADELVRRSKLSSNSIIQLVVRIITNAAKK
jgi:hypothetical protein